MKKLFINKNEEPAEVVEKILNESDEHLVLVIPKNSILSGSVSNFHILKREVEAAGKNLVIESVDDNVLALAQAAKIPGLNPFLSGRRHSMSDIIAPEDLSSEPEPEVEAEDDDIADIQIKNNTQSDHDFFTATPVSKKDHGRKKSRFKIGWRGAAFLVIALTVSWMIFGYSIPSAKISISLREHPWTSQIPVTAISGISEPDFIENTIGLESFTETKSTTLQFPASGSRQVERKASGTAIIYNAYSSDPQPLVATTRLLTPEGDLFRLNRDVVVPAAQVLDGEIIPSSIEVEVTADQPGEQYNIGPVSRFSIPGFQGTSRYEGFYAESKQPMSGGFIGVTSYPTDEDIASARNEAESKLKETLEVGGRLSIPDSFLILPGAATAQITEVRINEDTNNTDHFSVFVSGESSIMAIPEDHLKNWAAYHASRDIGFNVIWREFSFDATDIEIDSVAGEILISQGIEGVAVRDLDPDEIKDSIKGNSDQEVRDFIISLSGVNNAKISFWPIWVKTAPASAGRISITIE